MGQLVNNTVKAGHSKLALADYRASTDALDKGLKDLPVFFLAYGQMTSDTPAACALQDSRGLLIDSWTRKKSFTGLTHHQYHIR